VCETNVHHPIDSSLLQYGVRVLQRLAARAAEIAPTVGLLRDRIKAVRHRVLEIARAGRSQGVQSRPRRESSYRGLLRIVRPVVTGAPRIADKIADRRVTRHLGWQEEEVGPRRSRPIWIA
jgi:hypothetical protein